MLLLARMIFITDQEKKCGGDVILHSLMPYGQYNSYRILTLLTFFPYGEFSLPKLLTSVREIAYAILRAVKFCDIPLCVLAPLREVISRKDAKARSTK